MHFRTRNPIRRILPWVVALATLTLLAACVELVETPGGQRGTISGSLSYGPTAVGAATAATSAAGRVIRSDVAGVPADFELAPAARSADFVPGEIIVKFRDDATTGPVTPQATLQAAGIALSRTRTLAIPRAALYRSAAADRAGTLAAIDALNARPDVEYAHPNYRMEPLRTPNDPRYPEMWHFPAVDLDLAWDITTGASSTVVAVLDTGMLFGHPDAPVNLLSGYDFVSDPTNLDGDGRDADPTDPGPATETEYHGTHVTGTVAARTDNATGVAGVSWSTKVLPVRVMGANGDTVDISDAIIWAAGGSVPGVPDNPNPADVINLSLGGEFPCSQASLLQNAVYEAVTRGAIVVAAAGNLAQDASTFSPAACVDVFTVGAWNAEDERASYSNFGDVVDLMAPGGSDSPGTDRDGDGYPDGVLSLGYDDGSASYTYVLSSGTSMATPHVAGVIALMLAVEPGLTRTQIRDTLTSTARPYASSACSAGQSIPSPGSACGAGILDAHAAVAATASTPPPSPGELTFAPESVSLASAASSASVTLGNTGSSSLSWQIVGAEGAPENPAPIGDDVLLASPLSGTISGGGSQSLLVQIERDNVTTPGAYTAYYLFDTDGDASTAEAELPVTFIIPDDGASDISGPTLVEALSTSTWTRSGGTSSGEPLLDFTFSATPGSNYVYAWTDADRDGFVSAGDWYGDHPTYVQIGPGESVSNVNVTLTYVTRPTDVAAGLPDGVTLEMIEQAR